MRKIGIVIVLVAVVGVILAGCAGDSEPEPALEPVSRIVTNIPWPDNEFTGYVIQDYEGNDKGTAALLIERFEDIYFLKQYYVFQKKFGLTLIVNVRTDNLKPLGGGVTGSTALPGPTVIYSYEEKGKLNIDNSTPEGDQRIVIDVPEDAYDDNELLFLLRTIPFEVGYTASFTNVVATSAQKHVVTITVVGEEELQVPAGNFDAYKIELTIASDKKYLWYAKEKPHYLVKLDDRINVILLLKDIEEIKE